MSSLSESEVRKSLNRVLLLLKLRLHKILNGNNSHDAAGLIQKGQVADIPHKHLSHALGHGLVGRSGDEVGALGANLLDVSLLGGVSEEGDLADVVALTDDSGDLSGSINGDEASNVVGGELLDGLVDGKVLVDGVVNFGIATLVPCVGGSEAFLDGLNATELGLMASRLGGDGAGNSGGEGEHVVYYLKRCRKQ